MEERLPKLVFYFNKVVLPELLTQKLELDVVCQDLIESMILDIEQQENHQRTAKRLQLIFDE